MKKIAKLLFIAMLISVFSSACGSTEPEVFDMDYSGGTGATVDLEGRDIFYNLCYDSSRVLGFEDNTEFADLARARIDEVEKNMNCNIELVYGSPGFAELISTSYAGTFMCDILCGETNHSIDAARAGLLVGMSTLDGIIDVNDSEKWGNKNQLLGMCWEDDLYGLLPAAWPELTMLVFGYPLAANVNIISRLGLTDPRDYVENKAWTWAQFEECLEDWTIMEGGEVKTYGLSAYINTFQQMFIRTNGASLIEKTADGSYKYGFGSPAAVKAMEKAREIWTGDLSYTIKDAGYGPASEMLVNGEATMCLTGGSFIYGSDGIISKNVENFTVLPWPYGPDAEPGHTFSNFSGTGYCITIPVMVRDPESTAVVLDAVYEPLTGLDSFEAIKEHMSRYYFFDPRDTEVYFDMNLAMHFNFGYCGMVGQYTDFITYSGSVTSYIESKEASAESIFEEYVMPALRGAEAVWGSYEEYNGK